MASQFITVGAAPAFVATLEGQTRLQALRLSQQITGERFLTSVQLIKALGGSW